MSSAPGPSRPNEPSLQPDEEEFRLAPLPPGESLEEPQRARREAEPDLDLSQTPLAPVSSLSREQAELERDPAMAARLRKIEEASFKPNTVPAEPWIQFKLGDMVLVSIALAFGLGLGRLDPTGFATFFVGWGAVGVSAYVLLTETQSHAWKVAMFCVGACYLGAMATAILRTWLASHALS